MATNMTELRIYKDKRLRYRWTLKAGNGVIIGASTQGYHSKRRCMENCQDIRHALDSCFRPRPNYMIVDDTNE